MQLSLLLLSMLASEDPVRWRRWEASFTEGYREDAPTEPPETASAAACTMAEVVMVTSKGYIPPSMEGMPCGQCIMQCTIASLGPSCALACASNGTSLPARGMYINTTVVCSVPTEPLRAAHMHRFLATEGLAAGARFTDEIGAFVDKHDPIINITRADYWKPGSPLHEHLARFGPVREQLTYVAHFLTYRRALEWYLRQNPADDACLLMLEDDVERSGLNNRSLSEMIRAAPDFTAFFFEWCYGNPADAVEVGPGMYKEIAACCSAAIAWSPRGIREFLEFANVHGPSVIDVLTEKYAQTAGKPSCLYSVPLVLKQRAYDGMTMRSRTAADAAKQAWLEPKGELRPSRLLQVPSQRSTEGVIEVDGIYRYRGSDRGRDEGDRPHRKKDAELRRDAGARPPCFTIPEHFEPGAWRGNWVLDRRVTEAFFAPECPFYGDLFPLAGGDFDVPSLGNPDQDEHRLAFQSHSCNSSFYSSRELRLLLANRTVMFFGDSVSLGMATNLACALWKATEGQHATQHIRAAQDAMEQATEPSRCFKFLDEQIVCWISAATCAKFGSDKPNSRFCAQTDLRSLGHAITGASDFLRPNDVVVANAGVEFFVDNLFDQGLLLAELEGLCANVRFWGGAAPLVIWRETAAQNWAQARFPSSPNDSVLKCEALPHDWLEAAEPHAWMSQYNPYNIFLEPTLAECAGVRRLPVWLPSAMLGLKDRIGRRGECTHYFGPGSAHALWNTMLLDVLRNHETQAHPFTATVMDMRLTTEQGAARHSERWKGILSLLEGMEADGSGDVASG